MNGTTSTKGIIFDNTSSTLVLNGAAEMLERHRELKKKAEYVLLSGRSEVRLSDDKLAALNAALPENAALPKKEMRVFKRTKKVSGYNRSELVLEVKPKWGKYLIFM